MTKPAPSISSLRRITSWAILLLMAAIVVGAFAAYISSFTDMPWWMAVIGGVVMLAGFIGYRLGSEAVYKRLWESKSGGFGLSPVATASGVALISVLAIAWKILSGISNKMDSLWNRFDGE